MYKNLSQPLIKRLTASHLLKGGSYVQWHTNSSDLFIALHRDT